MIVQLGRGAVTKRLLVKDWQAPCRISNVTRSPPSLSTRSTAWSVIFRTDPMVPSQLLNTSIAIFGAVSFEGLACGICRSKYATHLSILHSYSHTAHAM